jgi:hypothetical protein
MQRRSETFHDELTNIYNGISDELLHSPTPSLAPSLTHSLTHSLIRTCEPGYSFSSNAIDTRLRKLVKRVAVEPRTR